MRLPPVSRMSQFEFFGLKKFLCIERAHTAGACSCNRLPINAVSYITYCKHAFHIGFCSAWFYFHIAGFIHLQLTFEYVRVWLVANGKEKTLNWNYFLLSICDNANSIHSIFVSKNFVCFRV